MVALVERMLAVHQTIDRLFYELYKLTEKEIKIVEGDRESKSPLTKGDYRGLCEEGGTKSTNPRVLRK
jgi:hypothetical protein